MQQHLIFQHDNLLPQLAHQQLEVLIPLLCFKRPRLQLLHPLLLLLSAFMRGKTVALKESTTFLFLGKALLVIVSVVGVVIFIFVVVIIGAGATRSHTGGAFTTSEAAAAAAAELLLLLLILSSNCN
jgi:hypothetical protein